MSRSKTQPPFFDGTALNLPPVFGWGSRIGAAPPQQRYPGWLNINRTQDVAISLTKVAGRHTIKGGFYLNHSFKAQNTGAGGGDAANLSFQGYVNFGNDTNNTLDTGFGYANAALGIFTNYTQMSRFIEGSLIYNQTEFYIQDNWKVSNRLTLDYGLRFVNQQPQHDQFQQMSNFFPDKWKASAAPVLYVAGCSNGAVTCSGNDPQRDGPAHRGVPDGGGCGEHGGGHRDADRRLGQHAERHHPGGQRDREDELRVAEAGGGAALRGGVRPDGGPGMGAARRLRAVLRPAGRQHRVLDPEQPADRDLAERLQRAVGDARAGAEPAADADDVRLRL